jgi:hypothetical protein
VQALDLAVPVEAVRALKGSMATQNVARGIFCGRFTAEAQRYAASSGITTVGGEALLDLVREVTGAVPSTSTSAARETRPAATTAAPTPALPGRNGARRTGRHGEFWGCAGSPAAGARRAARRPLRKITPIGVSTVSGDCHACYGQRHPEPSSGTLHAHGCSASEPAVPC